MKLAWVIGCGGLLGSALCRALRTRGLNLFTPQERFSWNDHDALLQQFEIAVADFSKTATAFGHWEIYWAAGVGTMRSTAEELAHETPVLQKLLHLLAADTPLTEKPGAFAFASSGGAIYAGARDYIICENTLPAPTTPYAYEKLRQEEVLHAFAAQMPALAVLLARISTIYGPGQAHGKQQGLLAHIARCIVKNEPIQIYVPFDTIRDYITADDAAARMISLTQAMHGRPELLLRLIAAEQPKTIAEIVAIFKRIARRTPRVVTSASKLTNVYARRIQFRSVEPRHAEDKPKTSLLIGIAQVMAAERAAYVRSTKPESPGCYANASEPPTLARHGTLNVRNP